MVTNMYMDCQTNFNRIGSCAMLQDGEQVSYSFQTSMRLKPKFLLLLWIHLVFLIFLNDITPALFIL